MTVLTLTAVLNTEKSIAFGTDKNGSKYAIISGYAQDTNTRSQKVECWLFGDNAAYAAKKFLNVEPTALPAPEAGKKTVKCALPGSFSILVMGAFSIMTAMNDRNQAEIFVKMTVSMLNVLYAPKVGEAAPEGEVAPEAAAMDIPF